jgi:hypothetical protein
MAKYITALALVAQANKATYQRTRDAQGRSVIAKDDNNKAIRADSQVWDAVDKAKAHNATLPQPFNGMAVQHLSALCEKQKNLQGLADELRAEGYTESGISVDEDKDTVQLTFRKQADFQRDIKAYSARFKGGKRKAKAKPAPAKTVKLPESEPVDMQAMVAQAIQAELAKMMG